jgi:SpoIID/LytB domain protein
MRITVLAILILVLATTFAQQVPPPPTSYTAPDWHAVLAGKAPLRVLVASRQPMLAWKGTAAVKVVDPGTKKALYTAKAGETLGIARNALDMTIWLRKDGTNVCGLPPAVRLESAAPLSLWTRTPDAWTSWPAPLTVTPLADGTFSTAVELPLDDYVRTVLPSEVVKTFHPQMLRAQAVVARTYALCKLGRHADEGADVCAFEHCQMYNPAIARTAATDDAVTSTRGLIVLYRDKLAEPYYSSCCGGISDDAGYVWGPEYARSYLTGVLDVPLKKAAEDTTPAEVLGCKDGFCAPSKSFRWTRSYTAADLNALVAKNLPLVTGDAKVRIRTVTNLTIEERTPFGRVSTLRVEGDGASVLVYGDAARWLFGEGAPGPNGLWSSLFDLTLARDKAGKITGLTIRGAGRGHGIGLCQWGADGRARAGQTYRQILHAYYPGTRISDEKKP